MATEIEDLIREYGARFINEQNALAEADLRAELGDRVDDVDYIQDSGLEVIWQHSPDNGIEYYRGLRRRGEWVVDHRREWPFRADI